MSFVSLDVDQLQIMGIRWKQRDELIQSCLISRDTQWSKKQQKLKRNSPRYNWGTSGGFTICWCGSVQSKKKRKKTLKRKLVEWDCCDRNDMAWETREEPLYNCLLNKRSLSFSSSFTSHFLSWNYFKLTDNCHQWAIHFFFFSFCPLAVRIWKNKVYSYSEFGVQNYNTFNKTQIPRLTPTL